MLKKGQRVHAKAYVRSGYFPHADLNSIEIVAGPGYNSQKVRSLARFKSEFEGIVVGISHRMTGVCEVCHSEGIGELTNTSRHPVVMVQPLYTQRWLKPHACLNKDLVITK